MTDIIRLPLGALASNCYIIYSEGENAVAIDPASSAEVLSVLERHSLTLSGIIITHGHFDHFAGAAALRKATGADIYAPELDMEMLGSKDKSWAFFMPGETFEPLVPDKTFIHANEFSISGADFRVMDAPGHTAGSCLLFCESVGGIFSGDVLFKNSVGRTDGFSGSERQMNESLKKISRIEGEYRVFPGHGDVTSLDYEKKHNPYLRSL